MPPRYMEHFSGGIRSTVIINGYGYSVHSVRPTESAVFSKHLCPIVLFHHHHFHHQRFAAPGRPVILLFSLQ